VYTVRLLSKTVQIDSREEVPAALPHVRDT
jgi:hypothetical protein